MTTARRSPAIPPPAAAPSARVRLTQVAFVLALGLVGSRATILETLREPFEAAPGAEAIPGGPGPGTSAWLDLLCLVPALLVLLRRLLDRSFTLRFTWSHAAILGFAAWALASPFWASDSFAAAVGSLHLVAAASLVWAMAQLVRSWMRLRIVAGFAFGLLLVFVAHGLIYRYIELPGLQQTWQERRDEILEERGWAPDSFQARQFENKIMNGEMLGFAASPNTFAAAIVLLAVIASGVAVQRIMDRDDPAWSAAPIIAVLLALLILWYTNSRTAFAIATIAAIALASLRFIGPWLATYSRRAYAIGLTAVLLSIAAVIAHGLYHGSLVQRSLTFRWRYWVASWRIFEDRPLLGTGWDNFHLYYLGQRLPEAAEEIRDPHNMLVRAMVELGIVGLALFVAWLARFWWEATRPITPPALELAMPQYKGFQRAVAALLWIAAVMTGVVLVAGIDYSQEFNFVLTEICRRLLYGALLFGGMVIVALRSIERQELDARPAPWMLWATLVAIGGFLLSGMLDVAPFEIGPMFMLALLAGTVLGVRRGETVEDAKRRPGIVLAATVVTVLFLAATITFFATPLARAQAIATQGDAALRASELSSAGVLYQQAFELVPINADYAHRAANAYALAGAFQPAKRMIDRAVATNPMSIPLYLTRAVLFLAPPIRDEAAALRDYQIAVALNPRDVSLRLGYAQLLAELGHRSDAVAQFREALAHNAAFPEDEAERLAPERIAEIEQRIRELGGQP